MLQEAKHRNTLNKQKIVGIKTNLFSSKILLFISFYTLNSFRSFQKILHNISSISVGQEHFLLQESSILRTINHKFKTN